MFVCVCVYVCVCVCTHVCVYVAAYQKNSCIPFMEKLSLNWSHKHQQKWHYQVSHMVNWMMKDFKCFLGPVARRMVKEFGICFSFTNIQCGILSMICECNGMHNIIHSYIRHLLSNSKTLIFFNPIMLEIRTFHFLLLTLYSCSAAKDWWSFRCMKVNIYSQ